MLFIVSELGQFIYKLFSKKGKLIGFFGLAVLAYLAGAAPAQTSDYAVYEIYYELAPKGIFYFERSYSELGVFFYNLGFDYAGYRLIFAFLSALILYIGVKRFTSNLALFSALYGVTVFFCDAVQIRNFMMISLVVLGISFLIESTPKDLLLAFFFIWLSAQFQSLGYLFFLVILVKIIPRKALRNSLLFVFLAIIFLMLLTKVLGISVLTSIMARVVGLFSDRMNLVEKVSGQYNDGTTIVGFLLLTASTLMGLSFESFLLKQNIQDDLYGKKLQVLYSGVLVSAIALPTLFLAHDYSRIQRNAFLFILISIALYFEKADDSKSKKWIMIGATLMVCFAYTLAHFHVWGLALLDSIPYLMRFK